MIKDPMHILIKTNLCLSFFLMALIVPGFIALANPIPPLVSDIPVTQIFHLNHHFQIGEDGGTLGPPNHGHSSAFPGAEAVP
jgi:hypothetical protein